MADVKKKMILEIDMDTGEVTNTLSKINKDLDKTGKKASGVGTKGSKAMGTLSKGLKLGAKGFGVLGKAIAATGIGAVVMVIALVVKKMVEMKVVMDVVEMVTAAMGAALKIVADMAVEVGEWLYWAWNSPVEAMEIINQKMSDFWNWIKAVGTMISSSFLIALKQVSIKMKEAAIAVKEFFGADASALKAEIRGLEDEIVELTNEFTAATDVVVAPFVALGAAIVDVVTEMKVAGEAAVALAKKQIALRDAQRALKLEYSKSAEAIAELVKQSNDMNLSTQERIDAATKAAAMEEELRQKSEDMLAREISLLQQEQKIQGESEERMNAINDLKVQQLEIQQQGLEATAALIEKVDGLEKDQEDARKEFFANQKARKDALGSQQAQEIEELAAYYAEQVLLATQYGFDTTELLAAQLEEQKALKEKHRLEDKAAKDLEDQEEHERRKANRDAMLQTAAAVLDGLSALNEAFTSLTGAEQDANAARELAIQEETDETKKRMLIKANKKILEEQEAQQKKGFENSKKIQIAQALIQTYSSAVGAFNSLASIPLVGPVLGGLAAAAAVAGGLAQVKMIKGQTFQGGGGGTTEYPEPGGASASGSGQGDAPTIDLSFLGGGATGNVQAYVVSNEVTNSQQSSQLIQDQASLVA